VVLGFRTRDEAKLDETAVINEAETKRVAKERKKSRKALRADALANPRQILVTGALRENSLGLYQRGGNVITPAPVPIMPVASATRFSFMCWNIRTFGTDKRDSQFMTRVARVITTCSPDIFVILEVVSDATAATNALNQLQTAINVGLVDFTWHLVLSAETGHAGANERYIIGYKVYTNTPKTLEFLNIQYEIVNDNALPQTIYPFRLPVHIQFTFQFEGVGNEQIHIYAWHAPNPGQLPSRAINSVSQYILNQNHEYVLFSGDFNVKYTGFAQYYARKIIKYIGESPKTGRDNSSPIDQPLDPELPNLSQYRGYKLLQIRHKTAEAYFESEAYGLVLQAGFTASTQTFQHINKLDFADNLDVGFSLGAGEAKGIYLNPEVYGTTLKGNTDESLDYVEKTPPYDNIFSYGLLPQGQRFYEYAYSPTKGGTFNRNFTGVVDTVQLLSTTSKTARGVSDHLPVYGMYAFAVPPVVNATDVTMTEALPIVPEITGDKATATASAVLNTPIVISKSKSKKK
jgi:endonuclease/exonuclease/phosphatase family metal-dependent hydrolase